ncbi:hypothetical protein HYC85_021161 [Camellia sinensis]|uniref:Secreted protein n=1 Tax=Camellia sinensis TaxID=4442 RepID=A0A7J7GKM3_CAMSI|nr:hypothetical protein HYC85_021161 [Camellia sinensis]
MFRKQTLFFLFLSEVAIEQSFWSCRGSSGQMSGQNQGGVAPVVVEQWDRGDERPVRCESEGLVETLTQ